MKPLYTKKNGTSQRVAAIEVTMPASYPSSNVTYGSGSVKDILDATPRIFIFSVDRGVTYTITTTSANLHLLLFTGTTATNAAAVMAFGAGGAGALWDTTNGGLTLSRVDALNFTVSQSVNANRYIYVVSFDKDDVVTISPQA